jgi:hypothetical protein
MSEGSLSKAGLTVMKSILCLVRPKAHRRPQIDRRSMMQRTMSLSLSVGLCMVVVFCAAIANADITTGLLGDWKFDEDSGTVANDSENGHTGTIYGASWIPGVSRSALNFNGSSDYVNVPDADDLDPTATQAITIAAWVKIPSYQAQNTGGSVFNTILGKAHSPGRMNGSYLLGIANSDYGIPGDVGKLEFNICYDGLNWQSVQSNSPVPLNDWVHVAFTLDASGRSNFYIDGALEGSDTSTITQKFVDTPYDLRIGHPNSFYDYFYGGMDEVRMYNRALTQGDVNELRSATPEPSTFAMLGGSAVGLLAYYWRKRWAA